MASARYETLYKQAVEACMNARSEICNRLFNWTGIDLQYTDYTKSTPRLKRRESVWLPDNKAVYEIIRKFNQDVGLVNQRNLGIRGWECGMCQMVDLSKRPVCKMLPFLLSAYLYNFPSNKFVQCYLKQAGIESAQKPFFSGIEKDDSIENEELMEGIEKLLRGKVANLARMRKEIFCLMDRFCFPEIVTCEMSGHRCNSFGERPTYLLPSNLANKFKRNTHTLIMDTSDGPLKGEAPPAGYDRYERWTIYDIFFALYVSISDCATKYPDYFAAKPDSVMCWILMTNALQDSKEIEEIESAVEVRSQDDLIEVYDKRIRELHDRKLHNVLKPIPAISPEGMSTRDMRKLVTVGEPSVLLKDEPFITSVVEDT